LWINGARTRNASRIVEGLAATQFNIRLKFFSWTFRA
jgi:hypothetical protein